MTPVILMATWNGERFLEQQLDSIRTQSHRDWQLLVRDDCSGDRTPALLERYARRDRRISILRDHRGGLGPAGNFASLMETAVREDVQVFAFADQDDVWEPHKLEHQLRALSRLQAAWGRGHPLLVYSDLGLIGADGGVLAKSFMARQHIRAPDSLSLPTLLLQNHVPGCSMLMNRALLELAVPVPQSAHMHDWWVALCAAVAGSSRYLPEPLTGYRLHGHNLAGAQGVARRLLRPHRWFPWLRKMNRIYRAGFAHAGELRRRIAERPEACADVSHHKLIELDRLLSLPRCPRPLRPLALLRMDAHCQNPFLTTLYYTQSAFLSVADDASRDHHDGSSLPG